jgi:GntR family transcriptional repressor for pyruvate dehydrogenase complex
MPLSAKGQTGAFVSRIGLGQRVVRARDSVADRLTNDVLELIKREKLGPGDRLPTVTALAALFEVAPPTIREALRRLQALGIVDIRHGSGVYVLQSGSRVIVSNPYAGQLDVGSIFDLIDTRLLIEPHVTRLAVPRCDRKAIKELEGILERAEDALHGPDPVLGALNLDFHRVIARLSGNTVLAQTIDSILNLYTAEQMVILELYDNREQDYAEHRDILEAMRTRNPGLAADKMREHLEDVRSVLERRLTSRKRR